MQGLYLGRVATNSFYEHILGKKRYFRGHCVPVSIVEIKIKFIPKSSSGESSCGRKVSMEKQQNRRKFFRLFVNPKFQIKYGLYYATIALLALISWNALTVYFLVELVNVSSQSAPGVSIAQNLLDTLLDNRWILLLGMTVITVMFMGIAIALSKNVVGPMRALLRHIEALKQGNYEHKTVLRKTDELKSMMSALNDLSDILKTRHGQSDDNKKSA